MPSANFIANRQRVNDQHGLLCLLEINHPSFSEPARIVDDTRSWTCAGVFYQGLPFRFTYPQDRAKESPKAQIQIDNVGRDLTEELERLPPSAVLNCTMRLVDRSTPNVIEKEWMLPMTGISATGAVVTATLSIDFLMRQPVVRILHDPNTTPGIFQE